jgi:hypothetical protein
MVKNNRSILSMLQRSMKGLCAIKTFNSKRHQQTWKKSKPRLSQESWTWWVKPPLGTKVSHKKQGAKRVFTPPLPLLPARGLLSTKADLLTGFGKAYLDYSKTMDWFSYSSIPGEKESQLLLQIFIASSSDLRVRLGDIFFLAQSLSPDLDSTGKRLFAMRPCKEGSLISITASLLCTRYLVAIPRKGPLPSYLFLFH